MITSRLLLKSSTFFPLQTSFSQTPPVFRTLLFLCLAITCSGNLLAHGSLENGRMLQVRLAEPNGRTPALWNDSYYTWNQNSQNFPGYASPNFSYAATVPDGTLASAGINNGVQSGLNFSGLNNVGPGWWGTPVAAGASVTLHFLATALHDPSHFEVYLTKPGLDPDAHPLAWADFDYLGRWAVGNATRLVTTSTRPNPVSGGTMPSYDWSVPIPANRAGHATLLVIWQRDDPAGEAFFSVQDLAVSVAQIPQAVMTRAEKGQVTLLLQNGIAGQSYALETSETLDAGSWAALATGAANSSGVWQTSDPNAASYPRRFYRFVTQP